MLPLRAAFLPTSHPTPSFLRTPHKADTSPFQFKLKLYISLSLLLSLIFKYEYILSLQQDPELLKGDHRITLALMKRYWKWKVRVDEHV